MFLLVTERIVFDMNSKIILPCPTVDGEGVRARPEVAVGSMIKSLVVMLIPCRTNATFLRAVERRVAWLQKSFYFLGTAEKYPPSTYGFVP